MANMLDYIKENGNANFEELPFNELDSLILSTLSYVNFENILYPGFENFTSIEDIAFRLRAAADFKVMLAEAMFMSDTIKLLHCLSKAERFKDLRCENYIAEIDFDLEKQFSAISFVHPKFIYVAYRGTDNQLVSWKEDFNLGYMDVIPAQADALDYLEEAAAHFPQNIYIGGHSKGGNLAVYSAVLANDKIKNRIINIYNFDGPGFATRDIWEKYPRFVDEKLITFRPQNSIVGVLMETWDKAYYVKSTKVGILQHDPFTWLISDDTFDFANDRTRNSYDFENAFMSWFKNLTKEETRDFVDEMYELIISTGASTTQELNPSMLIPFIKNYSALDENLRMGLIKTFEPFVTGLLSQKKINIKI